MQARHPWPKATNLRKEEHWSRGEENWLSGKENHLPPLQKEVRRKSYSKMRWGLVKGKKNLGWQAKMLV